MRSFRWQRPQSLGDAVSALRELGDGAQPIAGGQSLLLAMKARQLSPSWLVSLADISELNGIANDGGFVTIGATTTYSELETLDGRSGGVLAYMAKAISRIADTAVRSMATVGGAVCQADAAFDVPVLLAGCDATFSLVSATGTRIVSTEEFFDEPGEPKRRRDEILQSIRVADDPLVTRGFSKFAFRAHDSALASVAVAARCRDHAIESARVVVGGCMRRPTRAPATETWLIGRSVEEAAARIGHVVADEIEPTISTTPFSADYRRRILAPLAENALSEAIAGSTP